MVDDIQRKLDALPEGKCLRAYNPLYGFGFHNSREDESVTSLALIVHRWYGLICAYQSAEVKTGYTNMNELEGDQLVRVDIKDLHSNKIAELADSIADIENAWSMVYWQVVDFKPSTGMKHLLNIQDSPQPITVAYPEPRNYSIEPPNNGNEIIQWLEQQADLGLSIELFAKNVEETKYGVSIDDSQVGFLDLYDGPHFPNCKVGWFDKGETSSIKNIYLDEPQLAALFILVGPNNIYPDGYYKHRDGQARRNTLGESLYDLLLECKELLIREAAAKPSSAHLLEGIETWLDKDRRGLVSVS
jgi:hypothetical protein